MAAMHEIEMQRQRDEERFGQTLDAKERGPGASNIAEEIEDD